MKTIPLLLAALLMVCCRDRSASPIVLSVRNDSRDSRSASGQHPRQSDSATNDAAPQTQEVELWDPNDDRDITKRLLERVKQDGVIRIVSVLASRDKYVFVGEFEVSSQDVPAEPPMNRNGSEILRARRPLHGTDLWLVNKNGTELQQLTDDGESRDPVLSPSGEEIAFISTEGVRVINFASNGADIVSCGSTTPSAEHVHVEYSRPTFSPNGKAIAVLAKDGANSRVEVAARSNRQGCGEVHLAKGFERYEWNSESELVLDIGKLVFDSEHLGWDTESLADAAALTADKARDAQSPLPPELLKRLLRKLSAHGVMKIGAYGISPSGNRIVLEGVFEESPQYPAGPPSDLWLVNRDGSGLRRLTQDSVSYAPVWSPSGKEIAFTAFPFYSSVGIIDVKTGNVRWLSGLQARNPGAQGTHASWNWGYDGPRWSPNGRVIAAVGGNGEGDDWITVVDARSGKKLFQTNGGGYIFSWNHDGDLVIPALGKFVLDWKCALFNRH